MPHLFIDTSDQQRFVRDEDGQDYSTTEEAERAVIDALPQMAREAFVEGGSNTFLAIVRDVEGRHILHVSLSLAVVWLNDAPANPRAA